MVISFKDAAKLLGIAIIAFCAVLVCTLFLNFYLDLLPVKEEITSQESMAFYMAQSLTAKVVCLVSGGALLVTSVVVLLFYIKNYVDAHGKELGILKAIGYPSLRIASGFWVFGTSVLVGAGAGYGVAFAMMARFYALQNEKKMLPDFTVSFHPLLLVYLVILPAVLFALLSVLYAWVRLKEPALFLLKEEITIGGKAKKHRKDKESDKPFLNDMRRSTLSSRKSLVFFVISASFCYSAMTQMSFSMKDLSSTMMGVMILAIGLILAFTTLFLAITSLVNGNTKSIAMMRAFGYSHSECCHAILGAYRPLAYLGFPLGTLYQYGLLRLMVDIVFKDIPNMPEYKFDVPMMFVSLATFIVTYETVMLVYSQKIKKVSLKEIMAE